MHQFTELVDRCTQFTLVSLKEVSDNTLKELQTSGATRLVKNLHLIQLQKAIMAAGMFSLFESILQDRLGCQDGFLEASKLLDEKNETQLKEKLSVFQMAINVLKHGRGRSYNALVAKADSLPFKVKQPTQPFFNEGDVSEISTLIEIDDDFIMGCAEIIRDVSSVIRKVRPNIWL
jgi:hypothetical protein